VPARPGVHRGRVVLAPREQADALVQRDKLYQNLGPPRVALPPVGSCDHARELGVQGRAGRESLEGRAEPLAVRWIAALEVEA